MTKFWMLILTSVVLTTTLAVGQESDRKKPDAETPQSTIQPPAPATTQPTAPVAQPPAPAATQPPAHLGANVSSTYKIGPGDILTVSVWNEPEMSQKVPVRPDGMITLPLVGDIKAADMTTAEMQSALEEKLKAFVANPAVTVIVDEVRSHLFNVMGQVQRPGAYGLAGRTTILDGLAQAGGFKDFAKTKKIYVIRTMPDGKARHLPFNYNEVVKGKNQDQNVELQSHDTIIVP